MYKRQVPNIEFLFDCNADRYAAASQTVFAERWYVIGGPSNIVVQRVRFANSLLIVARNFAQSALVQHVLEKVKRVLTLQNVIHMARPRGLPLGHEFF